MCSYQIWNSLDFDRESPLKSNFASAKLYPEDVQVYLSEKIGYGAMLRPFKDPLIGGLQISPFITRENPNAPHCRVIIDLSFPMGNSINAGLHKDKYLNTPFLLKLPTIETITNHIKILGKGCMFHKVDINRPLRHIKLDPADYDLLGLCHIDWYVETCLPFGYHHGSALYQRLNNAVHHIMCC